MTLDEAERAEAEAYEALAPAFGYETMPYEKYVLVRTLIEAVRRTERLKAEALRGLLGAVVEHRSLCFIPEDISAPEALYEWTERTVAALAAYQEGAPRHA